MIVNGSEIVVTARSLSNEIEVPLGVSVAGTPGAGVAVFRVTGSTPFLEPFVDLSVTATGPGVSMSYNYTLLVDPVGPGGICADTTFRFPDLEQARGDATDSNTEAPKAIEDHQRGPDYPGDRVEADDQGQLAKLNASAGSRWDETAALEMELMVVLEDLDRTSRANAEMSARFDALSAQIDQYEAQLQQQEEQLAETLSALSRTAATQVAAQPAPVTAPPLPTLSGDGRKESSTPPTPGASETADDGNLGHYNIKVSAAKEFELNGPPGSMNVWIGPPAFTPETTEGEVSALNTIMNEGDFAEIEPFGPAFVFEPPVSGCIRIGRGGSDTSFQVTPQQRGEYQIGANVLLYTDSACDIAPVSRGSKRTTVTVIVSGSNMLESLAFDAWYMFREQFRLFIGSAFAIFFGLLLFLMRKKIAARFGYVHDGT